MTTTPAIDASAPRVPLARLVRVELRKSFDTRAGRWFTAAVLLLAVLVMLLQAFAFAPGAQDLATFTLVAGSLIGFFAPIIPILLVTQEWGQRTALVTFGLEPRRLRVVGAKFIASLVIVLAILLAGLLIAVIGAVLAGGLRGLDVSWALGAATLRDLFIANGIVAALGFAIATLLRNTPAAIVVFFTYVFAVPLVLALAAGYLPWFEPVRPWLDFAAAQEPLLSTGTITGEEWGHLATSTLVWIVAPLVVGLWRLTRAEVR